MLDKLRSPPRILNKPSRVSVVEYSSRDKGTLIGDCVFAKVEAGMILEKETLLLMPQNVEVVIRGIEQKQFKIGNASAGTICDIGLKLPNDFDVNYLKKGSVLSDP